MASAKNLLKKEGAIVKQKIKLVKEILEDSSKTEENTVEIINLLKRQREIEQKESKKSSKLKNSENERIELLREQVQQIKNKNWKKVRALLENELITTTGFASQEPASDEWIGIAIVMTAIVVTFLFLAISSAKLANTTKTDEVLATNTAEGYVVAKHYDPGSYSAVPGQFRMSSLDVDIKFNGKTVRTFDKSIYDKVEEGMKVRVTYQEVYSVERDLNGTYLGKTFSKYVITAVTPWP
ncbi:MAG TPA: hypothetical protein VKE88_02345 [Candidatus Nanoarchaeia archaeon]|nr:hypothetical protein [Candidatus Nanoarchaeia archaeon]